MSFLSSSKKNSSTSRGLHGLGALSRGSAASSGGSVEGSVLSVRESEHLFSESFRSMGVTEKNLSRVALSICRVIQTHEFEEEKGEITNNISAKSTLSNTLMNDPKLAIGKIHYCKSTLEALTHMMNSISRSTGELLSSTIKEGMRKGGDTISTSMMSSEDEVASKVKKVRGMINHHFLVLEVHPKDPALEDPLFIRAEKHGKNPEEKRSEAGITIQRVPSEDAKTMIDGYHHITIDCKHQPIGYGAIRAGLENEYPNYHITDSNCWEYAKNTTLTLLEMCIEHTDISQKDKAKLQEEYRCLETNLARKSFLNKAQDLRDMVTSLIAGRRIQ